MQHTEFLHFWAFVDGNKLKWILTQQDKKITPKSILLYPVSYYKSKYEHEIIVDIKLSMPNSFTKQFVPYAKYFYERLFVDIRHQNVFSIKVVM